ncbi:cytochrome b/b6 domain-containing protein [Pseudorhodobacter ferrugineus]|uniref:cytochrome b/b6 domain-containing protein n=1 Tax=Pseudorhodobacter ferrugineus TaxID=77008 RepID=UPI0003B2FCD1|nr:cytochrome b/b6 domain-containing protein [Pseudorhodobacter ferrugineus]
MSTHNTANSFGTVTRSLHWLTALLILTAIPLGIIANDMAYDTSAALAQKAQLFSYHKTIGIAAFGVAALRILWAITQTHPAPLHPERRAETILAAIIHWLLYISMLAVPLSGWVHHAATAGFAPILWPLGQDLPLIPKSESLATLGANLHWVFTKLLIASILLHIAGALKHHIIDKDATLRRMITGTHAPTKPVQAKPHALPLIAALMVYAIGASFAVTLAQPETATAQSTPASTTTGNWQVHSGTLALTVQQLGSNVTGQFANWQVDITFDDTAPENAKGRVIATINTTSLTLGSVSDQAKGPDFLNTTAYATATFAANISGPKTDGGSDYTATGRLTLMGIEMPLTLPFTLAINGDIAAMQGQTTIDRRDFGIGPNYPDEASVGFAATITVDLIATRTN